MGRGGRMTGDGARPEVELRLATLEVAGIAMHAGPPYPHAVAGRLAIHPVAGGRGRLPMHPGRAFATHAIAHTVASQDSRPSRARPVAHHAEAQRAGVLAV